MAGQTDCRLVWDEARLKDPHGQTDKAARVRAMFEAIAPTYELVNHVASAGLDRRWRRRAVAFSRAGASDRVLDVGCGTGDFARAFAEAAPKAVVGCDFSQGMLRQAAEHDPRPAGRPDGRSGVSPTITWCGGDALCLPFAGASFTLVGCAFGTRNFQELTAGLREMYRVLAAGGRAVVLEFSMPRRRLLGRLYRFYLHRVLPRLAVLLSGDRSGAYRYLPNSVSSFTDVAGMETALRAAGFSRVELLEQSIGIVTVFVAWKD